MKPPFVVFSLPRSRSAWMCGYLGQNKRIVGHDIAIWCKKPEDFFANFANGMVGTVEPGAMIAWQKIVDRMLDGRYVVVKRPVDEVERSLSQFGIYPPKGEMKQRSAMLDEISALPGVLTLSFADLYSPENRARLFEHCLGEPYDPVWDAMIAHRNIQIDVFERMRVLAANRPDIDRLKATLQ